MRRTWQALGNSQPKGFLGIADDTAPTQPEFFDQILERFKDAFALSVL